MFALICLVALAGGLYFSVMMQDGKMFNFAIDATISQILEF
jgi:hypothetical protein